MPKYAVLFNFKGEAVGALIRNPSDRPAAVREALESVGGRSLGFRIRAPTASP
jgi:uncharacterized protein with GYD domain